MSKAKKSRGKPDRTLYGVSDGGHKLELERTKKNLYLILNGKRVAKRGKPGTPYAKLWIPLVPNFEITEDIERVLVAPESKEVH